MNRYGCRAVTIVGALLAGCCLILSVFAKNVFTLFITIGVGTGFGFGLIYLPAIVSVTMYFERLRSLATGIAVCGSGLGTFIFAPLIEVLISKYGWQGSLLVISGIVFICAIFGAMFKPLTPVKTSVEQQVLHTGVNTLQVPDVAMVNSISNSSTPLQRAHSIGPEIVPNVCMDHILIFQI